MKKFLVLISVILVIGGSVAMADDLKQEEVEALTPADANYTTGRFVEDAQYQLSEDPMEKAGQQNQYAERRMAALEKDEATNYAAELLEELKEHEGNLAQALEALADHDEDELMGDISERLERSAQQRSRQLVQLIEDEALPEEAREGALGAIENQVNALQKSYKAMENARGGADREDIDPEQFREEAMEKAAGHLPEQVRERLSGVPASTGTSSEKEEDVGETPDKASEDTEGEDRGDREDAPGSENKEEGEQGEQNSDDDKGSPGR